MKALRAEAHSFRCYGISRGPSWGRSIVEFVYPTSTAFWDLLIEHESKLGLYSICGLELAFDFPAATKTEALEIDFAVVRHIRKKWHQRKDLWFEYEPYTPPPPGCVCAPTFYFEPRDSATALKIYCRHPKRLRHSFKYDQLVVRVEWTLYRARSVYAKTGIDRLSDIRNFDSSEFLRRNFSLERLNIENLGLWLMARLAARQQRHHQDPVTHGTAFLDGEARGDQQLVTNLDLTHDVKWRSSAQVRGYLRNERAIARALRGKLPAWEHDMRELTDYRLNSFFDDVTEQMAPWLEDF